MEGGALVIVNRLYFRHFLKINFIAGRGFFFFFEAGGSWFVFLFSQILQIKYWHIVLLIESSLAFRQLPYHSLYLMSETLAFGSHLEHV